MGVGKKLEDFERSLENIKKYFQVIESDSVRNEGIVSNTSYIRAEEFQRFIENMDIEMIWCASGGEILIDMLPYLDMDVISKFPKWIQGYSDPSSLLYVITTQLDIATIYGVNASGFAMDLLHPSLRYNLDLLRGKIKIQNSFLRYEKPGSIRNSSNEYQLNEKVKWVSNRKKIDVSGRLIGGCIDVLNDIIGSDFDYTHDFIDRYSEDGFIWYFDIYGMSAVSVYRTLFHMKYTGWFRNVKCFLFGRVLFACEEFFTYYEAISKAIGDIPFVMDIDIGHTDPKMTFINGCICKVQYQDNKGSIEMELK